jgi:4-amino-4-deoxy-L-arabinose transferase-like glycosyltransferase
VDVRPNLVRRVHEASTKTLPASTTLVDRAPLECAAERGSWLTGIAGWIRAHRTSLVLVTVLLGVIAVVHAWGVMNFPRFDDDEGTYVAQAWAVQNWHRLAHYTYWYDHPPLGWLLISLWTWATRAFTRAPSSVAAGREFALLTQLVSCALLYVLARRLRFGRAAAAASVLIFALSPLALHFHRMIFLDNVATPFLLAAFVLAASLSRQLAAYGASAACFAAAVLTKETVLLLLPAIGSQLWQGFDHRTREFSVTLSSALFLAILGVYPLFAALKGELVPGPGHVSLTDAVLWQLFERTGSGSVFDPGSDAQGKVLWWLSIDPWILVTAVALLPIGLKIARLRPVSIALLVQGAALLRTGYLPRPFIISVLPFAALLIGGVADSTWNWRSAARATASPIRRAVSWIGPVLVSCCIAAAAVYVVPVWKFRISEITTKDETRAFRTSLRWIKEHIPPDTTLLVDNTYWVDLTQAGYAPVIWFYKLDLDPAIRRRFPSWRSFDYVISTGTMRGQTVKGSPLTQVTKAVKRSRPVAVFGRGPERVEVRAVGANAERDWGEQR